jgi:hypothetical protein
MVNGDRRHCAQQQEQQQEQKNKKHLPIRDLSLGSAYIRGSSSACIRVHAVPKARDSG